MKIPDNYHPFGSFEEQLEKYRFWDFKNRKKNELKELFYKGSFLDDKEKGFEPCKIVGYSDCLPGEMIVVIELLNSGKLLPIDRRYLKQMQNKNFRIDQNEDEDQNLEDIKTKGTEILEFINNYVVYDIETTGLKWDEDQIIEIAALKVENGKIIDEFDYLINPDTLIDRKIENLTGITNLMLSSAPMLSEVLPKFKSFVGDSVLIGHNIKTFDNYFLCKAYSDNSFDAVENDYSDTLELVKKYFPFIKKRKLPELVKAFEIEETVNFHRAINDCHYTQKLYEIIKVKSKETKFSVPEEVLQSSRKRAENKTKTSDHSEYGKSSFPKHSDLRTIVSTVSDIDKNNPFYEKSCVFTGELKKYSREEAAQIIVNNGGKCENNVTKKTNFLIVSSDSVRKSSKQRKAEEYKLKGQDITIISEDVFYDMISGE